MFNVFGLIEKSWICRFQHEISKAYFNNLCDFIKIERESKIIYPVDDLIFNCFNITSFYDVKVVILGQDPYCGAGQAHGLAFSVMLKGVLPKSLINIYKELQTDLGISSSKSGDLTKWAKQGVLLLNSVLTVEHGKPGSHFNFGWEIFTDFVISLLSMSNRNVIFVLLGKSAFDKIGLINLERNLVIVSSHPSDISVKKGFFGSRLFSKININLKLFGKSEIDWRLD